MPYKDKAVRNAKSRERYLTLKRENPEYLAAEKNRAKAAVRKKWAENEAYREKRKADYKKWYDEFGKEEARERKGYKSREDYQAEIDAKRRTRNEYMKEWGKTDAGRRRRVARSIVERCGLSIDDYDRIYNAQQGKCRICGVDKERYSKDRLVVDHCHITNRFRALLCANCNSAIGLLGESEETMTKAIEYLREIRRSDA